MIVRSRNVTQRLLCASSTVNRSNSYIIFPGRSTKSKDYGLVISSIVPRRCIFSQKKQIVRKDYDIIPCRDYTNKTKEEDIAVSLKEEEKGFDQSKDSQETGKEKQSFINGLRNSLEKFAGYLPPKYRKLVILYGPTFIVLHDVVGLLFLVSIYTALSTKFIDIEQVINSLGISSETLAAKGINLGSNYSLFPLSYVIMKALDYMGFIYLRFALVGMITPTVGNYVAPQLGRIVYYMRKGK